MNEPVIWVPDAVAHMWDGHEITVEEANEALADNNRAWIEPDRSAHQVRPCASSDIVQAGTSC